MNKCDHLVRDSENMMHSAPFIKLTGAKVDIDKGKAKITLPMRNDFHHAEGAMHGALCFPALDNAAFFAANSPVKDVFVLKTIYHASRVGGRFHGLWNSRLSKPNAIYLRVGSLQCG